MGWLGNGGLGTGDWGLGNGIGDWGWMTDGRIGGRMPGGEE